MDLLCAGFFLPYIEHLLCCCGFPRLHLVSHSKFLSDVVVLLTVSNHARDGLERASTVNVSSLMFLVLSGRVNGMRWEEAYCESGEAQVEWSWTV